MFDFLNDRFVRGLTFFIAVVGFAQPYVYLFWRRLFRRRKLTIYETWTPDIGFSGFGPTIGLSGTINNENIASFITDIVAQVVRKADGETFSFVPFLIRKRSVSNDAPDRTEGTQWAPFQIDKDSLHYYDILFSNPKARSVMEQVLYGFQAEWVKFLASKVPPETNVFRAEDQAKLVPLAAEEFGKSSNQPFQVAAATSIETSFIWTAGEYTITMEINVDREKAKFSKSWDITLTSDQEQALRQNNIRVRGLACNMPLVVTGTLYFAYPSYKK